MCVHAWSALTSTHSGVDSCRCPPRRRPQLPSQPLTDKDIAATVSNVDANADRIRRVDRKGDVRIAQLREDINTLKVRATQCHVRVACFTAAWWLKRCSPLSTPFTPTTSMPPHAAHATMAMAA